MIAPFDRLPPADELARRVTRGEVSARQIAEHSLSRMREAEPRLNAVAIPLADLARQSAAAIDRRVSRGEDPGPLAGVPFTIKECYHVRGTRHSLGLGRRTERASSTSPVVQRLIDAGAIPIAKTNLSQLMLLYETDNPVYGRTNHPLDGERSPGGSGGGDAAAISAGYACFGIGTDLGGSVRQPAHSCGLAGFLPTAGRIEGVGVEQILPATAPLRLQVAPIARTAKELELVMQTLCGRGSEDGTYPAPLAEGAKPIGSMRVGFFESEDYLPACPTARRAVREAADALRQQGVELVPVTPPDLRRAVHLFCAAFGADGGAHLRGRLRGERTDRRIKPLLRMGRLPRGVRVAIAQGLKLAGQHHLGGIIENSYRCSAETLWRWTEEIRTFRSAFFAETRRLGLDAVLTPAHATVAYRHGMSHHLLPATGYAILANLLGAPAGVVPVTRVAAGEQSMDHNARSWCERQAAANLAGSEGLPCGVQILAAPWQDANVLRLMRVCGGERTTEGTEDTEGERTTEDTEDTEDRGGERECLRAL